MSKFSHSMIEFSIKINKAMTSRQKYWKVFLFEKKSSRAHQMCYPKFLEIHLISTAETSKQTIKKSHHENLYVPVRLPRWEERKTSTLSSLTFPFSCSPQTYCLFHSFTGILYWRARERKKKKLVLKRRSHAVRVHIYFTLSLFHFGEKKVACSAFLPCRELTCFFHQLSCSASCCTAAHDKTTHTTRQKGIISLGCVDPCLCLPARFSFLKGRWKKASDAKVSCGKKKSQVNS